MTKKEITKKMLNEEVTFTPEQVKAVLRVIGRILKKEKRIKEECVEEFERRVKVKAINIQKEENYLIVTVKMGDMEWTTQGDSVEDVIRMVLDAYELNITCEAEEVFGDWK